MSSVTETRARARQGSPNDRNKKQMQMITWGFPLRTESVAQPLAVRMDRRRHRTRSGDGAARGEGGGGNNSKAIICFEVSFGRGQKRFLLIQSRLARGLRARESSIGRRHSLDTLNIHQTRF